MRTPHWIRIMSTQTTENLSSWHFSTFFATENHHMMPTRVFQEVHNGMSLFYVCLASPPSLFVCVCVCIWQPWCEWKYAKTPWFCVIDLEIVAMVGLVLPYFSWSCSQFGVNFIILVKSRPIDTLINSCFGNFVMLVSYWILTNFLHVFTLIALSSCLESAMA